MNYAKIRTHTDNRSLNSGSEHGGNIYRLAEELGMPEEKMLDFSASINPLGVPESVKLEIQKNLKYLCNYPDPDARELRLHLSLYHSIDPELIICGNGSTELIYLIARALRPKKVLISAPAFSEYERAVFRAQNTEHRTQIKYLILKEDDGFEIKPDEFIAAMTDRAQNTEYSPPTHPSPSRGEGKGGGESLSSGLLALDPVEMAFLCNPNNPTGRLVKREDVLKIADAAEKLKCFLIVDEAFIDFCPEDSVINEVKNNPYLIVLRSMTKFYALTGLRIGYGVFPENPIKRIKEHKEPWTVNTLAQKAGMVALKDRTYRDKTFRLMNKEKRFLENGLKKIGIKFFHSDANFYLLKINDADKTFQKLSRKGILVRDCSNFRGLDNTYIRVAVKSRRENTILVEELERIVKTALGSHKKVFEGNPVRAGNCPATVRGAKAIKNSD